MFKVVHLSLTPLAGAPIRLVQALNKSGVSARLINFNPLQYGSRTFEEDIDFKTSPDEARELIFEADLIHLHHWIDLKNNPFGVDLSNKKVVRHFHSKPEFIEGYTGVSAQILIEDPLPQIVVGQFHERYYPRARPVPNLLNLDSMETILEKCNSGKEDSSIRICFFPTTDSSASERWDTKGKDETIKMMSQFSAPESVNLEFKVLSDLPHRQALEIKASCDIVFDEMVTGSYHLSGLEGLALGKPTFGYLDQRTLSALSIFSGTDSVPWINIHLSSLHDPLYKILNDRELRASLGKDSREWITKYWRPENLIVFYLSVYTDVLNGRTLLREKTAKPIPDITSQDYVWKKYMRDLEAQINSA